MSREVAMVLTIMALGVFGRNTLVSVAALCTLFLMLPPFSAILPSLADYGIRGGIFLLTLAVLAELASGKLGVRNLVQELTNVQGLLAILGGLLASWLSARGIALMQHAPQVVIGLVVGSVLGASFLGGVPVGPLFAAGLTYAALELWHVFFR